MRFFFVLYRSLLRVLHYPLISFGLFAAFACIGALFAPFLGADTGVMMRPYTLPFVEQLDALKITTEDSDIAEQIARFKSSSIQSVAVLKQGDEQCLTPRGLKVLRIQSLISDENNILSLPIKENEIGLNPSFVKNLNLREADKISVCGKEFTIRILRGSMEGGVELMSKTPLSFGLNSYIYVFVPKSGVSSKELLAELQSELKYPITESGQGGMVSYELVKEKIEADRKGMLGFYSSVAIILFGGAVFILSQLAALMRYHTQKNRIENGFCRQWCGLSGMMKEQLLSIGPVAFIASIVGFFLSLFALTRIEGTSPVNVLQGLILTTGMTTLFAVVFAFLGVYPQHKGKTILAYIKEDI